MNTFRTVLCPVELSSSGEQALRVATNLSRSFGTRLVLQHHKGSNPETDAGPFRPGASMPEKLGRLLAGLPDGLHYDLRVTDGPRCPSLLELARTLPADLIVLDPAEDPVEGSLSDAVLGQAPCPIVATSQADDAPDETPARLLVAVGTQRSLPVLDYAAELCEQEDLELHVLHVLGPTWGLITSTLHDDVKSAVRQSLGSRLGPAVAERAVIHIAEGSPADEIARTAESVDVRFTLMGTRARGRATSTGTCRQVLALSRRPVWFVPPATTRTRVRRSDPLDRRLPLPTVS